MKYEWRKKDKELYLPKEKPEVVNIKEYTYFMIDGKGNPNNNDFLVAVQSLYALSYAIRMAPKNGREINDYYEYTVFPLEGIWDLDEDGRKMEQLNKDHLVYTLMIRQPDFITNELFEWAKDLTKKKKPNLRIDDVRLESYTEGKCVQMMHIGSFDEEPKSFAIMEQFAIDHDLERISKIHKEIYISDPRKVEQSRLKTVLRFKVQ